MRWRVGGPYPASSVGMDPADGLAVMLSYPLVDSVVGLEVSGEKIGLSQHVYMG